MKLTLTLTMILCFTLMVKAQVEKKLEVKAGSLKTMLTSEELNTVTNLMISGTIDARDFKTMRDEMPVIAEVDMSQATIAAYHGSDGPSIYTSDYGADAIPQDAFYVDFEGKYSLRMVKIPLTTKVIEQNAFQKCEQMRSFQLPSNVTSIKENAFAWCSGLTSISIPESVTSIGKSAFYVCFGLTSITIPSSIDSIQSATFCGCAGLKQLEIPSSVMYVGDESFMDCSQLESVTLSPSLTTIGERAFFRCYRLTGSLTFPSTLTTIGSNAFEACIGLTSLIFPSSVYYIGNEAFSSCSNLTSIEMQHLFPPIITSYNVFFDVDKSTTILYVPFGTKKRYTGFYIWNTFTNIIEADKGFLLNSLDVRFHFDGGSNQSIELTADFPWTATADQSWITVTPLSGDSSQILTITAEANLGADKPRNGTVTLRGDGVPSQTILVRQLALPPIIHLTPGGLSTAFTSEEKRTITNLTLTGSMDARDFKTIHDQMPLLEELDISKVTIEAFTDINSTWNYSLTYPANVIPSAPSWNADEYTEFALAGHQNLTNIKLPASITSIGYFAFHYCTRLSSIELPPSVTSIQSMTFYGCTSLASLILPSNFNYIGTDAFAGCSNLKSIRCNAVNPPEWYSESDFLPIFEYMDTANCIIHVPFGTKERYKNAGEWGLFKNIVEMPGFSLSANSINLEAEQDSIAVLEILSGLPWTAGSDQPWLTIFPASGIERDTISFTAAANTTGMGRIATVTVTADTISQTITVFQKGLPTAVTLQAGALSTQFTREELNMINELVLSGEIDARDFKTMRDSMPRLSVIDLSKATIVAYSGMGGTISDFDYKANEIPPYAFFNNETLMPKFSLTSIQLPETANTINEFAFYNCIGLKIVETISPIHTIGNSAFSYCYKLTAVSMPSSVIDIGNSAFTNCPALTNLGQASLNDIGDRAFLDCTALQTIHISSTATSIGRWAFRNCSSLETIRIPSTMIKIEMEAFLDCISLNELVIEPGVASIGENAFSGCTALGSVELPNSLAFLAPYVFARTGLTSIVIPSSMTSIGYYDFYECQKLSSVIIPSSISWIEFGAFYNCTSLSSIYLYRQIPLSIPDDSDPFFNVSRTACTLYVPYGTKEVYQTHKFWGEFENIVEMVEFKLSKSFVLMEAEPDSLDVQITYNGSWTASSDQPWLTITPASGSGNQTIRLVAAKNESLASRSARITMRVEDNMEQDIMVVQKWLPVTLPAAGTLSVVLTEAELMGSVLVLTGEMDARDFQTITRMMPNLQIVDLSGVTIVPYSGTEGTLWGEHDYQANAIPSQAFTNNRKLTSILLPSSLTTINSSAFNHCEALRTVEIPSSVTVIDAYAFMDCYAITSILLPASLHTIGAVFLNTSVNLDTIYAYGNYPPHVPDPAYTFTEVDKTNCLLYVPYGSKELYAHTDDWKDFKNIVEMPGYLLSTDSATVEAKQGSSTWIGLSANVEWTASSNQPWLTVSPSSGNDNQTLIFTADANPADTARTATVTVSAPGIDPQTIVITQNGLTTKMAEITQNRPSINCYPNPFTNEMAIEIQNPHHERLTVDIYNMSGQRVRNLTFNNRTQKVTLSWDGSNERGQQVPKGIYLLKVNEQVSKVVRR